MPDSVHKGLTDLGRAHVLWMEIESWVGKHGGSADVSQRVLIDRLGWAPSTYWNARRQLVELGMLIIGLPHKGRAFGPMARRRMTLVHYMPRKARAAVVRGARRIHKAAKAVITDGLHPDAEATLARELAKAGAPPPAANGPPG
jgi:hypothetical protein